MEINKNNYKDWLIRYLENDLNTDERADMELFIKENHEAASEWDLLQRTRLQPDLSIRFPNKSLLFRTEEPVVELKKPVVVFKLYRYAAFAAAAAVLAFVIIFTIRKPETRIETAHSFLKNQNTPSVQIPEKNQNIASSQEENKMAQDTKSIDNQKNDINGSKNSHKSLIAKQMPNEPVKDKSVQNAIPEPTQLKSQPVAEQKIPGGIKNDTDKITHQSIMKEQLAIAKEPVNHSVSKNPVKTVSSNEDNDQTLLQTAINLFHHVSIKKQEKNQQTYYALSIQTPNISINKTIK